jgi:hypothetical protein
LGETYLVYLLIFYNQLILLQLSYRLLVSVFHRFLLVALWLFQPASRTRKLLVPSIIDFRSMVPLSTNQTINELNCLVHLDQFDSTVIVMISCTLRTRVCDTRLSTSPVWSGRVPAT